MSKCGLCGEDFGSGSHQILKCRAKRVIPKVIYDRMCVLMANEDDPEDFYQQKEEALDIMYELSKIYEGEECK